MMKRLLSVVALCLWCVSTSALWADGDALEHIVRYYVNGVPIDSASLSPGTVLTFPADDPSFKDNMDIVGWSTTPIHVAQNDIPVMVRAGSVAYMGDKDVNYYAVFAEPLVFKYTASMVENIPERTLKDPAYFVKVHNQYGNAFWRFLGEKNNTRFGADKFVIGGTVEAYPSYICVGTPKNIKEIAVGLFQYGKNAKFSGSIFIRTGDGVTENQIEVKTDTMSGTLFPVNTASLGSDSLYIQTSPAARVYGVRVTCDTGAYRTTLDVQELAIGSSGYGTICLPWHAAIPTGLKAYRLKSMDLNKKSGQLQFSEVSDFVQNQGYLVKGLPGTYRIYRRYYDPDDADLPNLMKGVTVRTARLKLPREVEGEEPFVLHNGCFVQYTGDTIPSFKGFIMANPELIQCSDQTEAAELRIVLEDKEEMVTSEITECIEQIDDAPEVVYDLSGRQMPFIKRRGLYIVKGKTVLVK